MSIKNMVPPTKAIASRPNMIKTRGRGNAAILKIGNELNVNAMIFLYLYLKMALKIKNKILEH